MNTKICSQCGIEKDLNEFCNKKSMRDGKASACKLCTNTRNKEHYINNKDIYDKRNNEWRINHQQYYTNYYRQYRKDNSEKILEIAKTQAAKRKGWESPQPVNQYFPGSHLHHTHLNNDHQACIYIPAELHNSVRHAWNNPEKMEIINKLAFEWLATQSIIDW